MMSTRKWSLLLLLVPLYFLGACSARKTPPETLSSTLAFSAEPTGTLTLVQIQPAAGTLVQKGTVLVADLDYTIDGFKSDHFFIMAQVQTTTPKMTTNGSFPSSGNIKLKAPTGKAGFAFPLRYVWDLQEVKHPLRVWFLLNERMGTGSKSIAKVGPIDYVEP